MRHTALLLTAACLACAGCIGSEQLDPGDLDRWSALNADASAEALGPRAALEVAGRRLPNRWVFRQHPSLVWSAISIVRARERLAEEAEEIEILISPDHARELADLMARGRESLQEMREVCEFDEEIDVPRWADGMAAALAGLEDVARTVAAGPAEAARGREPLGASAAPVLDMLVQYLNQRAGGMLLADVDPEDLHRVRVVLAQTVLQVGFAAAGRRPQEGLREAVVDAMQTAEPPDAAKAPLAEMLSRAVEQAPPASAGSGGLAGPVRAVLSYAPKALQAFEMLARQWDRMDHVAFEFHTQGEETVVAATLAVRDGQEVRLEDMIMFQPVLAFRGTSRVAVVPDLSPTGETVVAFQPVTAPAKDGKGDAGEAAPGGVEMRFEGLVWGLAKLFALPLADGRLREVRVFVGEPGEADRIINVAVVMEATGGGEDPRRVLHFQDVRRRRRERGPFDIRTVTEREEQVFNYLTPEKRYTFTRTKRAEE
ncbi:MAG: hypothetical protein R6X20_00560 [Phycisphaerae bacterium]